MKCFYTYLNQCFQGGGRQQQFEGSKIQDERTFKYYNIGPGTNIVLVTIPIPYNANNFTTKKLEEAFKKILFGEETKYYIQNSYNGEAKQAFGKKTT